MSSRWLIRLTAATLAAAISVAEVAAQSTTPQQTAPQAPPTPPNVDKIRDAVNRPPTLKVDDGQLKIYVEVIGRWPSFAEMSKGYDFKNGPTARGNPMTHNEFLGMVTPREMYSTAGIQPLEMLQGAIVNWLGQAVIKKGLQELGRARDERQIAEIRARIDRELAALKGGK